MASIAPLRRLMTALVVLVSLFVLLVVLAWVFQERIAFQPPRGPYPEPGAVKRFDYTASDGQSLFAYVVPGSITPPAALIAFHGNADLAVHQIEWAEEVAGRTGLTVILAEYRGYMGLSGRPSYDGVTLDAEAAFALATDTLRIPAGRLAYFGHSLGSAVATELAAKHPPQALVLEAPFTSARDMAARMMGSWFTSSIWPLVGRLQFNTAEIVQSLDMPVSVSHGGKDVVVPSHMGEAVYRNAKTKGKWFFVQRASHNDLRITGGDDYWTWLTNGLAPLASSK